MKSIVKILAILFGVTIISFMLIHFSNIDPAEAYARRNFINPTEKQIVEIRHDLGYDEPLIKQYKNKNETYDGSSYYNFYLDYNFDYDIWNFISNL